MTKIRLVFFFFAVLFVLIIIKLFYLQILSPFSSATNYLNLSKLVSQRGKIFDRNMQPLVLNQPSYLLYVEPKKVQDKNRLVDKLDNLLNIGKATLEAEIDQKKDWVAIASGLSTEKKDQITKLNENALGFNEGSKRYYPEASLAAQLLGFVGKNSNGDDTGYLGIEGYYDKDLVGLSGVIKAERDLLGRPILLGDQEKIESQNGRNFVLTIDKSVQKIIKEKLLKGMEAYKAKAGCVIIADPYSLEILGLSCLPDYDPYKYYLFSENEFSDQAISSLYEPGSAFKPLVMSAALNENKVKPDDVYDEQGPVQIGEYQIKTWDNKYQGKITMTKILEKSSNVGMVYVGQKLGNGNLYKYLQKYGFGENTEIDLQGEVAGYLKPKNQWYPIDYSTVTFGQGIAVTPIQMIKAFSAIINGGKLMKPHIVKQIIYDNDVKNIDPEVEANVISEKTSETIKNMLVATVEHGEYKWARPPRYKIGGKTGTAQIPLKGHYDPSKTIATFIGFAPADKPKFIALVMFKEPQSSIYGSETAAPLFFEIAKELFVYYNIPPQQ